MQRLRTVTSLDVSAVAGHHAMPAALIFEQKYWHISDINLLNFNETLTNDVVSFEQPGPVFQSSCALINQLKLALEMQELYRLF